MFSGFSVIIPTYNRPDSLERCLHSLGAMEHPGLAVEVIVVNDGGCPLDGRHLSAILPGVVIIEQANSGPSGARNTGIAAADHPHLAFTDDDCLVEPGWIQDLHAALVKHPTALVGGKTFNLLRHNPFSEASQLVVDAVCRWQNSDPENGRFIPSNNMACCREQIVALGGFDTVFSLAAAEDREICERWRQAGWPIVQLDNRALVGHSHWLDHRAYWRQQVNYGRGARTLHSLRRARGVSGEQAGAGFLVLLLVMALRRRQQGRLQPLFLLLVLESQLAIVVGNLRHPRVRPAHVSGDARAQQPTRA